jgi:hypothetical protein
VTALAVARLCELPSLDFPHDILTVLRARTRKRILSQTYYARAIDA